MTVDMAASSMVLDGLLAMACLVVGLHHLALLVTGRAPRAAAAAHATMGAGMAAMFVPAVDPLPVVGWVVVFAAVLAVAAAVAVRARSLQGDPGHLVVGGVAMLFMLLAAHPHPPAPAAGNGHAVGHAAGHAAGHAHGAAAATGIPGLLLTGAALALAAWFLVDVVRLLTLRARVPAAAPSGSGVVVSPVRPIAVPHVVMSTAMAIMLLGSA